MKLFLVLAAFFFQVGIASDATAQSKTDDPSPNLPGETSSKPSPDWTLMVISIQRDPSKAGPMFAIDNFHHLVTAHFKAKEGSFTLPWLGNRQVTLSYDQTETFRRRWFDQYKITRDDLIKFAHQADGNSDNMISAAEITHFFQKTFEMAIESPNDSRSKATRSASSPTVPDLERQLLLFDTLRFFYFIPATLIPEVSAQPAVTKFNLSVEIVDFFTVKGLQCIGSAQMVLGQRSHFIYRAPISHFSAVAQRDLQTNKHYKDEVKSGFITLYIPVQDVDHLLSECAILNGVYTRKGSRVQYSD